MSSETERITYEVMSRHDVERCAEQSVAEPSQDPESHHRTAIDPNFTNQVYMELESGTKKSTR